MDLRFTFYVLLLQNLVPSTRVSARSRFEQWSFRSSSLRHIGRHVKFCKWEQKGQTNLLPQIICEKSAEDSLSCTWNAVVLRSGRRVGAELRVAAAGGSRGRLRGRGRRVVVAALAAAVRVAALRVRAVVRLEGEHGGCGRRAVAPVLLLLTPVSEQHHLQREHRDASR